jgi:hypothetical protein
LHTCHGKVRRRLTIRNSDMHSLPPAAMRIAWIATLSLVLLTHSGSAQQPTEQQANAIRQSCRSDYQAHCASVPPGGAAALQCLQSNLASLSSPCRAAVGATQGAPAAAAHATPSPTPREEAALMRQACASDFRTYCRGVALGRGRALACLADHQESLSPPCREALAMARGSQ